MAIRPGKTPIQRHGKLIVFPPKIFKCTSRKHAKFKTIWLISQSFSSISESKMLTWRQLFDKYMRHVGYNEFNQ